MSALQLDEYERLVELGYPFHACIDTGARIATRTVVEWLAAHPNALDLVVFNVFGEDDRLVYEEALGG